MWPVVVGGLVFGGVLLKSKPDTDDEEDSTRPGLKAVTAPSPPEGKTPPPVASKPRSPIIGVTMEQWHRFRSTMEDKRHVGKDSPPGLLGLYRFSIPRLSDLGLCGNVRKDGKLWVGSFIPPLTRDKFAGHIGLQRRAFELSCGDFVTQIKTQHRRDVGREIDGQTVTLSGLVAVAHRAGLKGLGSWLSRPEDRKRFPHTTAAFKAANGVF